jgi:NAD(P)-dependent dehydrogenase (short-subunit alcohol dehydrogenase family)
MTTNNEEETIMNAERALVIGAGGAVGRATVAALTAAGVAVVATGRERDATDPDQVLALLREADPDLVVVAAGAAPRMVPIDEHTWESFSEVWNTDVKIAFEVGRAALALPLRPGATVVIVSSGAGLGGSPLSGGYAGAKRMQMFQARYLQRTSDLRGLGLRFVSVVPQQLIAGTPIGEAAAAAYGAAEGETAEAYMSRRFTAPLTAAGVAEVISGLGRLGPEDRATVLGVTAGGVQAITG